MRTSLLGFALLSGLVLAAPAMAHSEFEYEYNPRCGHDRYSGTSCDRDEGCGRCEHRCPDRCEEKVVETTEVVKEDKPVRVERCVRHVYNNTYKVHNVIHEVTENVEVDHVTVTHNIEHDKTIHTWRHKRNVTEKDLQENVDEKHNDGECRREDRCRRDCDDN